MEMLDAAPSTRTIAQWLADFAARVPVASVLDLASALENPFVTEHGRLMYTQLPDPPPLHHVAPPIHNHVAPPANAATTLGVDTDSLLDGLGNSAEQRAALRRRSIFG